MRRDRDRGVGDHADGVAVGPLLGHERGTKRAHGTGAVLHDHRLFQALFHAACDSACCHVGIAAGPIVDDERHFLGREVLSRCGSTRDCQCGAEDGTGEFDRHEVSLLNDQGM